MSTRRQIALLSLTLSLAIAADAVAAMLPAGFTEVQVASGLQNPTAMAFAPDGRLFVCVQGGQVHVIKDGTLLASPFVSLDVNASGERGLLGIAFDPDFANNQFVYVYYTTSAAPIHNRISRFTADGDVAVPSSEALIFELDALTTATNHNGGAMHFRDDGMLYVGVGENANGANAQSLDNVLGKILRINADGSIPLDNPFVKQAEGKNRAIWALGLRNPFTFAFEPVNGRMFINDVGQDEYEEIDNGVAGTNYGWPESEGPTTNPNHAGPIYYYGRGSSSFTGCAITGGVFYKPTVAQFPPEYDGAYFFADICGGWIDMLEPATNHVTNFAFGISAPVDLQVGPDGSLYYLSRGLGGVVRVSYTGTGR